MIAITLAQGTGTAVPASGATFAVNKRTPGLRGVLSVVSTGTALTEAVNYYISYDGVNWVLARNISGDLASVQAALVPLAPWVKADTAGFNSSETLKATLYHQP